ncbi:mitochondrial ribosomal protein L27, isoform CRA_c [Mus musculus]|nr:mitochondrial ribosomal protein L27, isoform CRA_c [Mus musculus]EDL15944.1 mitochondrial ribosomal protein L27, isoform CRA_c [Mus musculus]
MHPRRQVAALRTLVGNHEANTTASRKWKVTTFTLATSLALSVSLDGTREPMWGLGGTSACMPWRRG